ncbi:MAG: membrane protein insertion efficiency factor YidD [Candidatus Levybacteria bacterium CG10_big_fil_rev_8_21_14_0_10_36_7]|nr:MAG: membrane protein insertion efficiency factor YidD [Candidatus Levybacteria bacterium CG10_big_fil_rev_8_21_14_0_10_36_7]
MKKILLKAIKVYQKTPIFHFNFMTLSFQNHSQCKFTPTCSEYAYEAVKKHGSIKGGLMAVKRIGRCHPFASGGYDPVI